MPKSEHIAIPADPDDPEDFDVTTEALAIGNRSRAIRMARVASGLSQPAFARKFHIPVGTLRDWEQARTVPPEYAVAYARLIQLDPEAVAKAVA